MKSLRYLCLLSIIFLGLMSIVGTGGNGGGGGDGGVPTYTIRGSISVSANTSVDSDVNDIYAPYAPNDSFDTAQVISTPVTLGGYVNEPLTGDFGRSYLGGDESDFFTVALSADQTINLYIADLADADLDLYLYPYDNPDLNNPLDASVGTDISESLTVSSAGDYIVEVYCYSGASNYTLTVGKSAPADAAKALRLSSEFVPDEVIVRFKSNVVPAGAMASGPARALSVGMRLKAGAVDREMLLTVHDEDQKAEAFRMLGMKQRGNGHSFQQYDSSAQRKLDTLQIIKALRSRADVLYAEPNYIRTASAKPNDEHYSLQWHYPLINLPQAWDISTGSSDVIVAVVDTGVLMDHPDLAGQLANDGYDFVSNAQISADGDGIDGDPDDPGDNTQGGSSFHGTHVAGTIAAATNNTMGVAGIAWSVKIMPLRALGIGGSGTSYDIHQAIRYAAGLSNDSGTVPAAKADIINLSLGGSGSSQAEQAIYTDVRNAGVIVIAAAGNESTSQLSYPASYEGVVSVSAVDMNAALAPYSNYGTKIDVAAPGGDIRQDFNGDGYSDGVLSTCGNDSSGRILNVYKLYQGTSMASPHMAGVAALMKSVYLDLTPQDVDTLLSGGTITTDLGNAGRDDRYGYGLIDAYQAVLAAQDMKQTGTLPTALVVTPPSLHFGSIESSNVLTAQKQGDGTIIVDLPSDNAAWLTVSPESVDANGLGTYTAQADRTGLDDGSYTAAITFTSSENTIDVPVSMKVETVEPAGDAGFHYVMLLDPDTFGNKAQAEVEAENGIYTYSLSGVSKGSYLLYAGTDFDNDSMVGDAGEALGAYFSLDLPSTISVNGDLSGLDFTTSFNMNLPTAASQSEDGEEKRPVLYRMKRKHISR